MTVQLISAFVLSHYLDSTIPLLPKSEISSCIAWFVSDLVGKPEDRFPHDAAHFLFNVYMHHAKTSNKYHNFLQMYI